MRSVRRAMSYLVTVFSLLAVRNAVNGQLTVTPSSQSFQSVGQNVTFSCQWSSTSSGLTLEWFGPTDQLVTATSGRVSIFVVNQREVHLIISSVTDGDEGEYTCKASKDGNVVAKDVQLMLFKAVQFVNASLAQTLLNGTDALIQCQVTGSPPPAVKWRHEGISIEQGGRYTAMAKGLLIQNIVPSDSGNYTCIGEVMSMGSRRSINIIVDVLVAPVIKLPPMRTSIQGQSSEFACSHSGNPTPRIKWYEEQMYPNKTLQGRRYITNQLNGSLTIENVTLTDEGGYLCEAQNNVGVATAVTYLNVHVLPFVIPFPNVTAIEGSSATFMCESGGIPLPTLMWSKGASGRLSAEHLQRVAVQVISNMATQHVASRLTIDHLQRTDSDVYTCIARNLAGEDSHSVSLTVQYKPQLAASSPSHVYTWVGQKTTLNCIVSSNPLAVFRWRHDGVPVLQNITFSISEDHISDRETMSRLTVLVTDDSAAWVYGQYSCQGATHLGFASSVSTLKPAETPKVVSSSDSKVYALSGQMKQFDCSVTSQPLSIITWRHNDTLIKSNETFQISQVQVNSRNIKSSLLVNVTDSNQQWVYGQFACQGTNIRGHSETVFVLAIADKPVIVGFPGNKIYAWSGQVRLFQCSVTSQPLAIVTWRHNDALVISNETFHIAQVQAGTKTINNTLLINITDTDEPWVYGEYTCQGINLRGNAETKFLLSMADKPEVVNSSDTNVYAWTGQLRQFHCSATSQPLAVITWRHSGAQIIPDKTFYVTHFQSSTGKINSSLHVNITDIAEPWVYGEYACQGTNLRGKAETLFMLSKAEPESIVISTTTTSTTKTPTTFQATGDPSQTNTIMTPTTFHVTGAPSKASTVFSPTTQYRQITELSVTSKVNNKTVCKNVVDEDIGGNKTICVSKWNNTIDVSHVTTERTVDQTLFDGGSPTGSGGKPEMPFIVFTLIALWASVLVLCRFCHIFDNGGYDERTSVVILNNYSTDTVKCIYK